ncbi:MAG: NUDIX hydrolase [Candidatus Altiarchaeota archaeon]
MQKKKTFLTVDAIILNKAKDKVVLIKRRNAPFKDFWALPGGLVEYNEKVENAVVREAKEECNLDVKIEKLFNVYSSPGRDPRGHSVSITFICIAIKGKLCPSSDAKEAKWFSLFRLPNLAFDHEKILEDLKKFLQNERMGN